MKAIKRSLMTSFALVAAVFGIALDARSQSDQPMRRPISESSITLPDYFGIYAVDLPPSTVPGFMLGPCSIPFQPDGGGA